MLEQNEFSGKMRITRVFSLQYMNNLRKKKEICFMHQDRREAGEGKDTGGFAGGVIVEPVSITL